MTQTAGEIYASFVTYIVSGYQRRNELDAGDDGVANYRRLCRLKLSKTLLYSYMEPTASSKQPSSLDPEKSGNMGHNSDMSHIPNNTGHVDGQCQDARVRVRILKRPPMPPNGLVTASRRDSPRVDSPGFIQNSARDLIIQRLVRGDLEVSQCPEKRHVFQPISIF